jgi:hypothetical protein
VGELERELSLLRAQAEAKQVRGRSNTS